MNSITEKKGWIPGLDTIRIILAVIVMLGHANLTGSLENLKNESLLFKIIDGVISNSFVGLAAVIGFFIISGIVIHFPYRNGKLVNWAEFILKRYLRIFIPMLIVAGIAMSFDISINSLPFWSLYCELIYYTLYPVLLFFLRRYKVSLLSLIIVAFACSYLLLIGYSEDFRIFLNQSQNLTNDFMHLEVHLTWIIGLPFWLLGLKLADQYDDIKDNQISVSTMNVLRVSTFISAFLCSVLRYHFSLSYTITMGVFGIIAFYWIRAEIRFWNTREPYETFENAGKWSYSLYLCHMFPFFFYHKYFQAETISTLILLIGLALLFSYAFYLLVERPSHVLVKKIRLKAQ